MALAPPREAAFTEEVLRINARWNLEVIESFGICPFARGSRTGGGSVRRVAFLRGSDIEGLLDLVTSLEKEPSSPAWRRDAGAPSDEPIEVAQVIFPVLGLDHGAFLELTAEMGRRSAARSADRRPEFVHAAFHPALPYSTETPPRLVPYFRRSPDPLVQLIRLSVLDDVHANRPRGTQFWGGSAEELQVLLTTPRLEPVTDRITRENHGRAVSGEMERMDRIFETIAEDRRRSYAPFLDGDAAA